LYFSYLIVYIADNIFQKYGDNIMIVVYSCGLSKHIKKGLKIPKGESEAENRGRDKTMGNKKGKNNDI
jgi:hypothetical protein